MSKMILEIVLDDKLRERMEIVATSQGKSLRVFIQEALYTYTEDVEDGVMSDVALSEEGLEYLLPEGADAGVLDSAVLEASRKTA